MKILQSQYFYKDTMRKVEFTKPSWIGCKDQDVKDRDNHKSKILALTEDPLAYGGKEFSGDWPDIEECQGLIFYFPANYKVNLTNIVKGFHTIR